MKISKEPPQLAKKKGNKLNFKNILYQDLIDGLTNKEMCGL